MSAPAWTRPEVPAPELPVRQDRPSLSVQIQAVDVPILHELPVRQDRPSLSEGQRSGSLCLLAEELPVRQDRPSLSGREEGRLLGEPCPELPVRQDRPSLSVTVRVGTQRSQTSGVAGPTGPAFVERQITGWYASPYGRVAGPTGPAFVERPGSRTARCSAGGVAGPTGPAFVERNTCAPFHVGGIRSCRSDRTGLR